MPITDDAPAFERQGFLKEDFRLFHLKDKVSPCYEFHYHDFLKIMVLLEGKVNYVIEGRSYSLHPFDIVLVGVGTDSPGRRWSRGSPMSVRYFTCPRIFWTGTEKTKIPWTGVLPRQPTVILMFSG